MRGGSAAARCGLPHSLTLIMKCMLRIAMSVLLLAICLAGSVTSGPNRIVLVPEEKIVSPVGSSFALTLALDSAVRNARFFNVHISFDTTVLGIDSIVPSPEWNNAGPNFFFWKDTITIDTITHQPVWYVDLGAAYYGAVYHIDGYAPLAKLWLTARKSGATFSYFHSQIVLDANSTPVLDEVGNAIVFVCPNPYPFFGDFDHTGNLDIADLTFMIAFLYLSGPSPEPSLLLGDVDCDQLVDISDVTRLIDYLYISFTPICSMCP